MHRRSLIESLVVSMAIVATINCATEETYSINKIVMRNSVARKAFKSIEPITCFCNLPVCVTTTYMCKSESGACFSDSTGFDSSSSTDDDDGDNSNNNGRFRSSVYGARHGCVELLTDKKQRQSCQRNKNNVVDPFNRLNNRAKTEFACCKTDMCNYPDSTETNSIINETLLGAVTDDSVDNRSFDKMKYKQEAPSFTSSDVWFKAAIIAVPICGIVILLVLILLAVHILKTESSLANNNYKFSSIYMPTTEEINCDKMKEHLQLSQNLLSQHHRQNHRDASSMNNKSNNEKTNLFPKQLAGGVDANSSYFDFANYIDYGKSDLCKTNLYPNLNLQRHIDDDTKIYVKE